MTYLAYRRAAGLACVLVACSARGWLESIMFTHMLVQLPLLFAAGWLLFGDVYWPRWLAVPDRYGLTSLTTLLFISAYWMIPRALEQSLQSSNSEIAKTVCWILAGALLPAALRRARLVIQLFYLGNFCWMTAIAGIQYQNMPQRLCNAYLLGDQSATGVGLVVLSILIAIAWCLRHASALLSNPHQSSYHAAPGTEH